MNIRFHNLGKIKETELDLKPMTVIIGPNNSNKTYIAYSVYGLWQTLAGVPYGNGDVIQFRSSPDGLLTTKIDAIRENFTTYINKNVSDFVEELEIFFQDSSRALFANTKFDVSISSEEFSSALNVLQGATINLRGGEKLHIDLEKDVLVVSATQETATTSEELQINNISPLQLSFMLRTSILGELFAHPYLLPAERNAFVITYKVLANRRLKLMLDAQRRLFSSREASKRQLDLLKEAGEVRYPQPIEDFLELLFEIETETNSSSQNGMGKLAANIENSIQNGNKINFRATALGGQEIMVDVGNGLNIDLYNASSSIKQLAPLLLYLRYRAAKGDLLIIDEPEMNLHPESQAKLLEVLAMLVNEGVYVLLTTHSPYIMAHLNNLAHATEVSAAAKRKQAKSLYLGDAAALLDMDQISAYEMRDNQLHSLKDPDYGIRWDTLSDVSGDLQQKFFQIYEEGQTPERAKTTRKPAKATSK